jgi:hypothetical protein
MGVSTAHSTPFPGRFRYIFQTLQTENSKFKNCGLFWTQHLHFHVDDYMATTLALPSMVTLKQPSSFNAAEKIDNFLSIGDSCYFAAEYLKTSSSLHSTQRRPTMETTFQSRSERLYAPI